VLAEELQLALARVAAGQLHLDDAVRGRGLVRVLVSLGHRRPAGEVAAQRTRSRDGVRAGEPAVGVVDADLVVGRAGEWIAELARRNRRLQLREDELRLL